MIIDQTYPNTKPDSVTVPEIDPDVDLTLYENVLMLALLYHGGQKDKNGKPYIDHLLRVSNRGKTMDEKILGLLHDIIEDTNCTYDDLVDEGVPVHLLWSLDAITHRHWDNEPRTEYYDRILADELAHIVKEYDIDDNNNPERVVGDEETRERLATKYRHAREYLGYMPYDEFVERYPNGKK